MKLPWTKEETMVFRRLSSPVKIQDQLESFKYNSDNCTRPPREVIKVQRAHCFDGALFAAAALEFHGDTPRLVDLRANHEDDDHVLAVFQRRGLWGAIAKSNYTGCRYRDPIYRTVRELVMSYFNIYFNLAGKKTLREYSRPFAVNRIPLRDWRTSADNLDCLGKYLDSIQHYRVIPKSAESLLSKADRRLFKAEVLGLDKSGAFKVRGSML